ncbi:hypothetical protein A3F00_02865 [Candidatus Daviesbacteria bacterium RIFCSPHIGHO2_12_FULL_37_11]|uniref:DUF2283 domain-containing protein n=1 Tax=Candidatus Daviesbacteria bacterium RIFCSPHIGHO2_12_FULL_37_11 TaxID=1797777 RepID=A0A1F5KBC7_9BACT|nr:MAG: hypothetical protein A2769_04155 [Candidatus Daviesbacteria bacterium RIFCSPHIGHO2_01_FULL_37_27]OGE38242.1 MAG: hypothetical protein A3F00_02865 [Candidatus Daviesbacteria bacterium RIFCSPHIGHO2_12_FULL_37_11]OGE46199.1 MAG: hypothetical protein A3B39_02630 [Candidatus Daviesbacteria bacterium RIFCSPLOWO2_01_FULL_37_10]
MSKKNFNLEFDKEDDILYLTRGGLTKEDTSEELGDDVVIWRNKKTNEVSGFTVLNFSKRSSKKTGKVNLPIEFELHPLI